MQASSFRSRPGIIFEVVAMTKSNQEIEDTKRLMGALVRMKPKPHEEMKVGQRKATVKKSKPKDKAKKTR